MAKKQSKKTLKPVRPQLGDGVEILNAGSVLEDPITRTLETNYMPYAMSVIVSRALPEIDGFKPAHRKLLYTMYEMGLLKGARTKSANIVGSTMHLNPHGDAAIYDTMVRMGRGNESLLVPFVDSKGNFGKAYSRDMSCAAARYTEAKLEGVCEELFRDIDKETVDFVPNYDSTTTEPTLLPVTFPTILANNTLGIAVGMACNICSFNLAELCATTVALMKDEHHDIGTTMPAPDFVGGGQILYDEAQMREIYENGRGSVKVRARYNAVPGENMIEVTQIPPTTTVEAIMDKSAELVKTGKVKFSCCDHRILAHTVDLILVDGESVGKCIILLGLLQLFERWGNDLRIKQSDLRGRFRGVGQCAFLAFGSGLVLFRLHIVQTIGFTSGVDIALNIC